MSEFIKRTVGNITYVDFPLHGATIAMADGERLPVKSSRSISVLEPPAEVLPEELITITNFLKEYYPEDYSEISTQISQSCSTDIPGHIILQEILATLEADRPLIFRRVSKILTGVH